MYLKVLDKFCFVLYNDIVNNAVFSKITEVKNHGIC